MMQSINTSPDTPEKPSESIQKSMDLADLQVKVMNFKMSEATIEGIDALFKGFDDDETAQKLKENMLNIIESREKFSDEDLVEQLLGFKPKSAFIITPTPTSFDITFYSPADWMRADKESSFIHNLITKGRSGQGIENKSIPVNYYNPFSIPFGFAGEQTRTHELRHSLNKIVHPACRKNIGGCTIDTNLDKESQINQAIDFISKYKFYSLKEELSAYITDGSSEKKLLLWTFRSRLALGLYNIRDMPKNFWNYLAEKGFDKNDIQKVKQAVKINIKNVIRNSYEAIELLQQKGYSRDWAVSFLCTEDNFMEDWLEVAEACPTNPDR